MINKGGEEGSDTPLEVGTTGELGWHGSRKIQLLVAGSTLTGGRHMVASGNTGGALKWGRRSGWCAMGGVIKIALIDRKLGLAGWSKVRPTFGSKIAGPRRPMGWGKGETPEEGKEGRMARGRAIGGI